MKESSTVGVIPLDPVAEFYASWRDRVRVAISELLNEELEAALGANRHERQQDRLG